MPITIDSQHDARDYTALAPASARGWLWEAGEQLRGRFPETRARKDADGLHIDLTANDTLHVKVAQTRSKVTVRAALGSNNYNDHVCAEARCRIEIDQMQEALHDAIQWGRSRLDLAAGEGYAEEATA